MKGRLRGKLLFVFGEGGRGWAKCLFRATCGRGVFWGRFLALNFIVILTTCVYLLLKQFG
jgi:hypothetical protein